MVLIGWKVLILMLCVLHVISVLGARSGPFKAYFTRVEACSNPTLPMDPNPPTTFFAELYNTTTDTNVMRGKTMVLRDHRIKKLVAKSYIWVNNKWKLNYMITNMCCNRILMPVLTSMVGYKYEPKTCTSLKGEYTFNNINADKSQHIWMMKQEYGRVEWRIELFSQAGSCFCWEFESLVVPADN